MSDVDVTLALDAMERMLQERPFPADPTSVEDWRRQFDEAVSSAERGPRWAEIMARAHALAGMVEEAITQLSARRDAVREELNRQNTGARALKGYCPK